MENGKGLTVKKTYTLRNGVKLFVSSGSVVNFTGDCIVNAANTGGLGGGGVDGAINAAGGRALKDARKVLPVIGPKGERILVGGAVITVGGKLKSKHVIHAVGPNYHSYKESSYKDADQELYDAYKNTCELAMDNNIACLAFSLLSAGVFRGNRTLEDVLQIAINAILKNAGGSLKEIHLCGFLVEEITALVGILESIEKEEITTTEEPENKLAEDEQADDLKDQEITAKEEAENKLAEDEQGDDLKDQEITAKEEPENKLAEDEQGDDLKDQEITAKEEPENKLAEDEKVDDLKDDLQKNATEKDENSRMK